MKNITSAIRDNLGLGDHYDNELVKVLLYKLSNELHIHYHFYVTSPSAIYTNIKHRFNEDVSGLWGGWYTMFNGQSGYIG